MRKIFSILTIIILFPIHALADCQENSDSNPTGCVSYNGCFFVQASGMMVAECRPCMSGTYNNNNTNITDHCPNCPDNYNQTTYPGRIPDPDSRADGQSECPWKCDINYYKSGDNCALCPADSSSADGSTSIDDCKCVAGKYMGGDVCRTCPANTTNGCPCGTTAATVQCQSDYTKIISSDGVVTCAQCPQNAILNGATCECNIGYYATTNGTTSTCAQCPFGTTTVATGATSLGDCQMNNTTLFCDANGENCMNLIPSGITINAQ